MVNDDIYEVLPVGMDLHGRRKIKWPITNDIEKVMNAILGDIYNNHVEESYLYKYYRMMMPVLNKKKDVRPEINHKARVNYPYEIVSFKVGFQFSEPVQYIQKSKEGATGDVAEPPFISALNELMEADGKDSKDRDLAEWMYITGHGYKAVFEGEETPFETEVLDPRNGFVCYDTGFGKKPWLCGICIEQDGTEVWHLYTKQYEYTYSDGRIKSVKKNVMGVLPIVEYPLNTAMLGSFEVVIDLIDFKNQLTSNRLDGVDQQIQSLMKFINVDIDENGVEEFRKMGAIKLVSNDMQKSDVEILSYKFDQSQSQILADEVDKMILEIAGVPDRQASAGGNTGQALIIGQGWANAESRARSDEKMFKRSEREYLKIIKRLLNISRFNDDELLKDINLKELDIKFNRNRTDNLLVKVEALQGLINSGIDPRAAIQVSGLFSDVEEIYVRSADRIDKILFADEIGNQDYSQE